MNYATLPTTSLPDNEIDEILRINLNGAIYVAKHVSEQMKRQKCGYIINMSSIGGKIAASFAGIYAASKFGLSGFSEALAKEMSSHNSIIFCFFKAWNIGCV